MKLKGALPSAQIASFRTALGHSVSVKELERTLDNLDLSDDAAVLKAVRRCNNRCHGNRLRAQVYDKSSPTPLTFEVEFTN
jgi:hypothetical protein